MKSKKPDPCDFCGGRMKPGRVTVDLRKGRSLVVVEDVPAQVCGRCHHRYYPAYVVRELDEILAHRAKSKRNLKVPVLTFGAVA